jgi:hypothetical protein
MLFYNLVVASGLVVLAVTAHFLGLAALIAILRSEFSVKYRSGNPLQKSATIVGVVLSLFLLHTVEIWGFAAVFILLGETQDLELALYFSASNFSTLGISEFEVSRDWRLLGAIESVVGFILIGWSTAFLVSVTAKMGLLEARLEHDIRAPGSDPPDRP